MITYKTVEEIKTLLEGGKILSNVLSELAKMIQPGVTGDKIDLKAKELASKFNATCSFYNYEGFPAHLCLSINDEIVHGIPYGKVLNEGDLVGLDLGIKYKNLYTDSAVTVIVPGNNTKDEKFRKYIKDTTFLCLKRTLKYCTPKYRLGDIGYAVQSLAEKRGFSVVKRLVGHGVGYEVHEDPYVPNVGEKNTGLRLKPGMVIAIEPMICQGTNKIIFDEDDGWTFRTADGKLSAHFEWTVAITEKSPIVLTPLGWVK